MFSLVLPAVQIYRVGQKSKLSILSEHINKAQKIGERGQIRTATEK